MAPPHQESGHIRKVWPLEKERFRAHLLRLDPESRRLRFGSPVNDDFVERYCRTQDHAPEVVHGCFVDGELRAAAELRPLLEASPLVAELAFSVEQPWQDIGIGTRLLERSLRSARNMGIAAIWMICLRENLRMQRVARKFEAQLRFDPGGVRGTVDAPAANLFSWWREGLDDGSAFVTALIDDTFSARA
jgi:GNAT superfamily N-acetyltransferase